MDLYQTAVARLAAQSTLTASRPEQPPLPAPLLPLWSAAAASALLARASRSCRPLSPRAPAASAALCGFDARCRRRLLCVAPSGTLAAALLALAPYRCAAQSALQAATCTTSSYMYVAGFQGAWSFLNGYYAPYYNASQAPPSLRACTNNGSAYTAYDAGYYANFDPACVAPGHPAGYYNTRSNVSDSANVFWVRDYEWPASSYWNLVLGTADCLAVSSNWYVLMSVYDNTVSGECARAAGARRLRTAAACVRWLACSSCADATAAHVCVPPRARATQTRGRPRTARTTRPWARGRTPARPSA